MALNQNTQANAGLQALPSSLQQNVPRRLACRRCNRQKVQCRWEEDTDQSCIRCHRANVACLTAPPRRLGRPAQGVAQNSAAQERGKNHRSPSQQRVQRQVYQENDTQRPRIAGNLQASSQDMNTQVPETSAPASTQYPAPATTATSSNLLTEMNPVGEIAQLNVPNLETGSMWAFSDLFGPAPMPSENTYLSHAPLESNMPPLGPDSGCALAQSEDDEQERRFDSDDSEYRHQPPGDPQDDLVHRLWNFQLLLNQQLKQIRSSPDMDATKDGNPDDTLLSVDHVLANTESFLDMLRWLKSPRLGAVESRESGNADDSSSTSDTGATFPREATYGVVDGSASAPASTGYQNPLLCGNLPGPLFELDTTTICVMVSCYARLVELHDEIFQRLGNWLHQSLLSPSVTHQWALPVVRLGNFQLRNTTFLQVTIVARLFLDSIDGVEKCMHIFGQSMVPEGEDSHHRGGAGEEGNVRYNSESAIGSDSVKTAAAVGRDKVLNVILALEAGGSGGHAKSITSLRGNVKRVREALEKRPLP